MLASISRNFDPADPHIPVAVAARQFLLWPALLTVAIGASTWAVLHPARLVALSDNSLAVGERIEALKCLGGTAGLMFAGYVGASVVMSLRSGWPPIATIARLNRALSFFLSVPFVVALLTPKIEADHPSIALLFVAAAAAFCVPCLTMGRDRPAPTQPATLFDAALSAAERPRWRDWAAGAARWLPAALVAALWIGYSYFFSRLSIVNHQALNTRTADLGFYDNIFYQSIHGRPLGCTLLETGVDGAVHFHPLLVVLSPLYLVYPRAEMLLVLQSIWLGAGAIPVYLIAKTKLQSQPAALVFALVYLLYPALHGANLNEFHSLALLATPLLWTLYFLETAAVKRYYVALAITLLVCEDAAWLMCCASLFAWRSPRRELQRLAWPTLIASLGYYALAKNAFMTSSALFMGGEEAYSFASLYHELIPEGTGAGGFFTSLATNPIFALKLAMREPKLMFLATLLVPLLLLPLVAERGRELLLYGLLFILLASKETIYSVHFHYAVLLFPVLFFLAPAALFRLEHGEVPRRLGLGGRRMRTALLGAMLVAALLTSWKFGALVDNASFRGGAHPVVRQLSLAQRTTYAELRALVNGIPADASVTATERLGPHVSNRRAAYRYRQRRVSDFYLVDDSDLRDELLQWHRSRVVQGRLVHVQSVGRIVLYRLEPSVPDPEFRPTTRRKRPDRG